jgi:hypothetical protein
VAGSCEHGNNLSGTVKSAKFLKRRLEYQRLETQVHCFVVLRRLCSCRPLQYMMCSSSQCVTVPLFHASQPAGRIFHSEMKPLQRNGICFGDEHVPIVCYLYEVSANNL